MRDTLVDGRMDRRGGSSVLRPLEEPALTLSGVSAGSVLHQDVVERLIGAVAQLMHPHGGDPLGTHGAFRVPAVHHAVIPRPAHRDRK